MVGDPKCVHTSEKVNISYPRFRIQTIRNELFDIVKGYRAAAY